LAHNLVPIVIELSSDRIPNIRLNVAKTLQTIIPLVDSSVVESKIKPALSKLLDDKDKDVKYFSSAAIGEISSGQVKGAGVTHTEDPSTPNT